MKSDLVYLGHILEAIDKIENYLKNINGYDLFKDNDLFVDAVVREIEIIGEASNNISKKFQKDNPEIPWRKVIGIRNHLIHEYFGVNTKVVWDTYKNNLPKLKELIKECLK